MDEVLLKQLEFDDDRSEMLDVETCWFTKLAFTPFITFSQTDPIYSHKCDCWYIVNFIVTSKMYQMLPQNVFTFAGNVWYISSSHLRCIKCSLRMYTHFQAMYEDLEGLEPPSGVVSFPDSFYFNTFCYKCKFVLRFQANLSMILFLGISANQLRSTEVRRKEVEPRQRKHPKETKCHI